MLGTSVVPESKRGKVIWVWDGAYIIELILDHSLAAFPVLKDSKDRLASLTKFFSGAISVRNLAPEGVGLRSASLHTWQN